ncbi:DUF3630 family protein [Vibrio genomosp. F10]|uniref:Aminopeptidase n=2 Tax=Vibrio genomosp. F10 TaxID=723171 RepID=A0A1B9QZU2_9VIBR|nr:DUF3630 family protein [Vibrio genomosp. F10]OCH76753.1 aminopeptidase [Vibrio genomosp. F10]OEE33777.1 aminopeptidase [Vibrio genomosp. F10 str. ZF-129]OEE96251.1 aminopeptidase [Vibrio genomosp. F10 str. 9ZC157]
MDDYSVQFRLHTDLSGQGRILIDAPHFDFDSFEPLGEKLVSLLSAEIVEKQCDADLHSWLIDFEGCQLFLKAEHYSESLWLEALSPNQSKEELDYLCQLFRRGF